MPPPPHPWPATPLPRFEAFLHRLAALPSQVGGTSLLVLRDGNLPSLTGHPNPAPRSPERVEGGWLSAALGPLPGWLAGGELERAARLLLDTARALRPFPDWALTALWLLEVAAALDGQAGPILAPVESDLGDLYCRTGQLEIGQALLRQAEEAFQARADLPEARRCSFRSARWRARLLRAPEAGAELRALAAGADDIALFAELELLFLERDPNAESDGLVQTSLRAQAVLARAEPLALSTRDRLALRALADHLVARAFAASPNRYIRDQARALFEQAVAGHGRAGAPWDQARALDGLGRALASVGRPGPARQAFERAIAIQQRLRDCWGLGASFNGLGDMLVRHGQPLEALPLYEANVLLLRSLGGMARLVGHNLRRQLSALLLVHQSPFATGPPDAELLGRAVRALATYGGMVEGTEQAAHHLLLAGSWQRVAALAASDVDLRRQLLAEGQALLERAGTSFRETGQPRDAARAGLHLAHLLLDKDDAALDRARARRLLEEAEPLLWDDSDRLYLELLWARHHQVAGQPRLTQRHLAAARRSAELNGAPALASEVDDRLGVVFLGPTGEPEADVVLSPEERLDLEVQVVDWRGRPLPGHALCASLEGLADEPPPFAVQPATATTDHLGRAVFTAQASGPGQGALFVGGPNALHGARLRLWAEPCQIEHAGGVTALDLAEEDMRLFRQLFGPGYCRLRIHRRFGAGRSGANVLLVEPFRRDGEGERRAQPCIVKVGPRRALREEWERHEQWVKDVLPVNVSRCERFAAWNDRAALRMGLAAGQDWVRAREACEWLTTTSAFEAHLLLERVFVGDLASCWYTNAPRREPPRPLAQSYGRIVPPLLLVEDTSPPRGLLARRPAGPFVRATDGLLPPALRGFGLGEEVMLDGLTVAGFRPCGGGWEYELRLLDQPLRIAFRTPLPPELIDREGNPQHLLSSAKPWALRGLVVSAAYDGLDAALRRCAERFRLDHPDEGFALSEDGAWLQVGERRLPSPLPHLHGLLFREFPCQTSIVHGDLHGRNVIVGHQGQPFYIDFGKTGPGPTLFDFIKYEVYLWHENFAGWPQGDPPVECDLTGALRLLDDYSAPDPWRRFPSPYALLPFAAGRTDWRTCFAQCLATLRSAARPYIVAPQDEDYFVPLCLTAGLMLRWCDAGAEGDERAARQAARCGVMHALVASSLLANGVVPTCAGQQASAGGVAPR